MSDSGRLTVPADARRELGLEGETEFEVEIDKTHDALILRPAVMLLREDAWAYTPEHRAKLAQAHAESEAGRVPRRTARHSSEPSACSIRTSVTPRFASTS